MQWGIGGLAFTLWLGLGLIGCGAQLPTTTLTEQEQQGQTLYAAHCASCHGLRGEGSVAAWQRPNPDGTFPPPPHDDTGHTWHHPDGHLYLTVRDGGSSPDSAMPAFGERLTHEEIVATIEYIKTFWSEENRASQSRVSQPIPYPTPILP